MKRLKLASDSLKNTDPEANLGTVLNMESYLAFKGNLNLLKVEFPNALNKFSPHITLLHNVCDTCTVHTGGCSSKMRHNMFQTTEQNLQRQARRERGAGDREWSLARLNTKLFTSLPGQPWTCSCQSKQPIRTRYLGHVTGYQPIREQYFVVRCGYFNSLPGQLGICLCQSKLLLISDYCCCCSSCDYKGYLCEV